MGTKYNGPRRKRSYQKNLQKRRALAARAIGDFLSSIYGQDAKRQGQEVRETDCQKTEGELP